MLKKILIVDDSALMRKVLSDIIMFDERFVIADMATNGFEAFDLVTQNPKKYDAIILDLNMPKMNGIQFLEQINKHNISAAVLIVSTIAKEGAAETIHCLELGAFDFVTKPDSLQETKGSSFRDQILAALTAATENMKPVHVAKKSVREVKRERIVTEAKPEEQKTEEPKKHVMSRYKASGNGNVLIALACSTGGPKALQQVIPFLPKELAAPMLIVQHMPEGFTNSLASRLNEVSNVDVKEAEQGDALKEGHVYVAKGGCQMRLTKQGKESRLAVTVEAARGGLRPCADIMYESLVDCDFDTIVCVVLTGMGSDGMLGIRKLSQSKKVYVIAQDEATSTVYGMPRVVKEEGLTDEVVELSRIAEAITRKVGVH